MLRFENRYRCQDGSYRWIEWRSYVQDNLIYAAARDITDRKEAELALKASENALKRSQELAHIGHWTWDTSSNIVNWSDEMLPHFWSRSSDF